MSSKKIFVGILGATGAVGQRFIQLLQGHPWFEIHALGASERNIGKDYLHAVHWLQTEPIPQVVAEMVLSECSPTSGSFSECKLVFSALDAYVAGPIEEAFSKHAIPVFSNAKNFRHSPLVPLLVPQVNPDHIQTVSLQMKERGNNGFIVTNPNCSTTGLVVPLKAIDNKYGIEEAVVFTMQAVSGAGYPGVSSMDILDNVIPFIDGEEHKVEKETRKILGSVNMDGKEVFVNKKIKISAHTNRVPVLDGHTICVSLRLANKATPEAVKQTLREYTSEAQILGLPSAPVHPIKVLEAPNRPQPRLDRNEGNGFTVTVGRVRSGQDSECTDDIEASSFDIRLTLLVHNTILGAAGGSIIHAELAKAKGFI
eukprot:TRINITY_DN3149_c0_g1_i1.p1 TRINITY_DN3149_c0_g1~~TRINITY_DN3149_c0_g1_i1.p1  ORF type:complete len:369 (+),score=64.51 TRINITY_DN3149_c0_g1_i1:107-1213(+)